MSANEVSAATKPALMLLAEARMALQYLARAESWALDFDAEIVARMSLIHRDLLQRIEEFAPVCRAMTTLVAISRPLKHAKGRIQFVRPSSAD
jgi:hypothetical protein